MLPIALLIELALGSCVCFPSTGWWDGTRFTFAVMQAKESTRILGSKASHYRPARLSSFPFCAPVSLGDTCARGLYRTSLGGSRVASTLHSGNQKPAHRACCDIGQGFRRAVARCRVFFRTSRLLCAKALLPKHPAAGGIIESWRSVKLGAYEEGCG